MAGPLSGYRIVDLTAVVSGPLATMLLADQGADVIKIENPAGGDFTRAVSNRRGGFSASFLNNNRNKRSVAIDLKDERGLGIVKRLVAGADVLVQNFRPGVVERMGLGEEQVHEIAPRLVYVSISGFGDRGPYAGMAVYDPLIQALSGLTTIQAGSDEARPRLVRTIVPDKVTGLMGAQAITAALLARERTGRGQHVRLSMLDSVIAFLWHSDMGSQTFVGAELPQQEAQSFIDLIYETADGYVSVAAFRRADWVKLARACDHPEWIDDPRFLTSEGLELHKLERLDLTQQALRERTSAEWIERLEAHDVPCAPVLTRRDMIRHPQVIANGILVETDHPRAGRLRQAGTPVRFSATPSEHRRGGPELGGHTREVLAEAGYSATEIQALVAAGAAMDGEGA
jgi:crotonobetainyl-CoA:carnitine CoA-transferase CaiB-like acyl-CoA transferase